MNGSVSGDFEFTSQHSFSTDVNTSTSVASC